MKSVIRKGVFETNSSSTHSLSLRKVTSKEVDKDASFEIRSNEAKIALLFGLIENAEMEYNSLFYNFEDVKDFQIIKERIVKEIEKSEPELLNSYDAKKDSLYDLSNILLKMKDASMFDYYFFKDINQGLANLFVQETVEKKLALSFKESVIEEYCKLNNYTKEQALLQIDYEEFSDTNLREILKDEATAKEKLKEYAKNNQDFKDKYKSSGMNNIVDFAKEYYEDDFNDFQAISRGRFRCDKYFSEGCLNDCYCGFESYIKITEQFKLDITDSDAQIQEKARAFLSDDCKIVAKEYWNGLCLEHTGEIF